MPAVLLVAATDRELCGHDGLVCGVGPVEAAAATARALALRPFDVLLHVGVAGGRGLAPGTIVVGTEAVYCDLSAEWPVVDRVTADPGLVEALRTALPAAATLPVHTSAAVGGARDTGVDRPARRGDGGLRGAARRCARERPRGRGARDLERDRGGGPRPLADPGRARCARAGGPSRVGRGAERPAGGRVGRGRPRARSRLAAGPGRALRLANRDRDLERLGRGALVDAARRGDVGVVAADADADVVLGLLGVVRRVERQPARVARRARRPTRGTRRARRAPGRRGSR